jgi:hypothetical protein
MLLYSIVLSIQPVKGFCLPISGFFDGALLAPSHAGEREKVGTPHHPTKGLLSLGTLLLISMHPLQGAILYSSNKINQG